MEHKGTHDQETRGDASSPDSAPPANPDRESAGERDSRRVRDTVILYSENFYNNIGINNIPMPEFRELTAIIGEKFGIHIGENKVTLLTGRIHPILERHGFANHRDYINAIRADTTGELLSELANRVSTNHTAFYREEAHFKLLANTILPELVARKTREGSRDIRVWSAACATGEEPYTILFTLMKYFNYDYHNWRAGVLATDISGAALDTARRGLYNAQKIATVPWDVRKMYFNELDHDNFEVKPEYRGEVTFRRLNLVSDVFPFKQCFDIIFCRNVMIYFARLTRTRLLDRLREWLLPGGYLFIGHSESLVESHPGYESIAPAVYARKG